MQAGVAQGGLISYILCSLLMIYLHPRTMSN